MSKESDAEKTDQMKVTKEALKHIPEHEEKPVKRPSTTDEPKMFKDRRKK